uniref:EF-hand domain-containing protein n=1 Tax=Timema douglasi TaxID=61478 RepID=A0A7R8Z9E3_TIMDO|nr:unnamed protein product [Timema douglasi]
MSATAPFVLPRCLPLLPLYSKDVCHGSHYLRTAFGLLDRNRDGHVTASELQFMLQNMGIQLRDELVHDLINEASESGSGLIDEAEFLQWVARIQSLTEEVEGASGDTADDITKDLVAAFRVFDRDCNGLCFDLHNSNYIFQDELKTAMDIIGETVTEVQLNEMLAIADIDKDGKINYEALTSASGKGGGSGTLQYTLCRRLTELPSGIMDG